MEAAIVSAVVEELVNMIKKEAYLLIGVEKEVKKLHSKFKAIQAVLVKAGRKQLTDETIRDWLGKIKDVAYEVEDILDEWRIDALISRREKDDIGNQRKVRSQYSCFPCQCFKQVKLRHETGHRIREIIERLDEISKEKSDFSFNEDVKIEEVELMQARETGSLIDESMMVFGRDRVKESIINELISDNNREQKSVSITSIVGMGGLGKTTLAQLVCNDESVKTHFNEKIIWVCVSDPFDVSKIAKKVIKSLSESSGSNPENSDLDTFQHSLLEAVSKMPFLLVLDDVWNEDETLWKQLKVPLMGAAQGSQILVTTRSRKAAEVMETIHFHDLEHLSHSDCWNLFKSIAFKGAEDEEFQELTKVGEDIVWRCKGLPLAVRAKADIEVDLEEIGEMYFDDLLARSFFQDAEKDYHGNIYRCKMHDLVHDLATRVNDGDYHCMENEDSPPTNCHHLSLLVDGDVSSIPSPVCEATRLRTLLLLLSRGERPEINALPDSLFNHLRFLRALDVSKTFIENLPSSISKLKHLRYLNLSGSKIKELPESVTDLCNLQTLKLNSCQFLCMLPSGMSKMVQLRHLEIEGTDHLRVLPNGLGNLTTLRTLSKFPVGDENGGRKIGELKNLNLLTGKLMIENLERVVNVNEAREAQLNKKSYLQTLCFYYKSKTDEEWKMSGDGEMERMEGVFEGLGPLHSNLKKLEIKNYVGSKFPSWLEDFQSLTEVTLENCRKLRQLPSLGNLCSLKSLKIVGADEVKVVGVEFYRNGAGRGRVFPKLERLHFDAMANWEEWKLTDEYEDQVMPSLKELIITKCNKLKALPDRLPCNLRAVTVHCEEVTWMPCDALPLLEFLSLGGHVKVELSPFPALKTLKIEKASYEMLPFAGWELLESLHTIHIVNCPRLEFLPDWMGQLETLHNLMINGCSGFTSLFNGSGQFKALRFLDILWCRSLRSLSDGLVHFEALESVLVFGCPKLQSLFDGFEQLKSLRWLFIGDCPELKHFPPLQYLTTLETLGISECPLVKEQLEKEIREDRCNVSHICHIYIDGERIRK
ncbi:hypothetical protein MRB53_006739 [Persea americana]|uniref:Uncharacterized protein n=1 Tax=Persea americana TaxID=3435 RepID=A0ACC2MHY0_PERAE|nr:hypothetical protein MRB53_006739 [Persea americana]